MCLLSSEVGFPSKVRTRSLPDIGGSAEAVRVFPRGDQAWGAPVAGESDGIPATTPSRAGVQAILGRSWAVRCSSAPTSAPSLSGSAIISIAGASIARAIPKTEQPHRHYTGASVSLPDMATTCADVELDCPTETAVRIAA
jgi:hypothetical protein